MSFLKKHGIHALMPRYLSFRASTLAMAFISRRTLATLCRASPERAAEPALSEANGRRRGMKFLLGELNNDTGGRRDSIGGAVSKGFMSSQVRMITPPRPAE